MAETNYRGSSTIEPLAGCYDTPVADRQKHRAATRDRVCISVANGEMDLPDNGVERGRREPCGLSW